MARVYLETDGRGHGTHADPFLEEVCALKRAAAERAGNDVNRLCDQLEEIEKTTPNSRAKRPELGTGQREKRAS